MYREDLVAFIKECISKGLPMPINWTPPENADDSEDMENAEISESAPDEDTDDSASPETQESVQAEDDPGKEVRDDCGSQSSEECHGGSEATRSVADSPSVAENGQECRDSDQTTGDDSSEAPAAEEAENKGTAEGENAEEASDEQSDSVSSDGKNDTDGTTEENQGTSEHHSTDEAENRDTAEGGERELVLQALYNRIVAAQENYEISSDYERATAEKIYNVIVEICKLSARGVRNQQTKWDVRKMSRDICCFRRDRLLHDKHWSYRPRKLAIFWDQSGSCSGCFSAVANAIKEVAKLGYRCWLYDCSNGIAEVQSIVFNKTNDSETTMDNYNNGPRLRRMAEELGCNLDDNIISPNEAEFIKICQKFDTVIILQDYDCIESVWLPAAKVPAKKCPYFVDLEEDRYDHPCEHDWNPHLSYDDDWPVPSRWYKIREM